MNDFDNAIEKALTTDPIAEAERLTGNSYKDDPATSALGFLMLMENGNLKRTLLEIADDTTGWDSIEKYVEIVESIGFEEVLRIPFDGRRNSEEDPRPENQFFFWHPDGILLIFDTYNGEKVNSGNFYYNWQYGPSEEDFQLALDRREDGEDEERAWWKYSYSCTSSGTYSPIDPNRSWRDGNLTRETSHEWVWVGSHDCREGLKHKLKKMKRYGKFLPKWARCEWIWALHYGDTRKENYNNRAITYERLMQLPDHVREAIGPAINNLKANLE